MKKRVEIDHFAFMKRLAEYPCCIIVELGLPLIKMPVRKGYIFLHMKSFGFFLTSSKFKKDDPTQMGFLDDLMLLVVKGLLPTRIVKYVWF
jgi:hypothetical protein